jgi:hypothetical protein
VSRLSQAGGPRGRWFHARRGVTEAPRLSARGFDERSSNASSSALVDRALVAFERRRAIWLCRLGRIATSGLARRPRRILRHLPAPMIAPGLPLDRRARPLLRRVLLHERDLLGGRCILPPGVFERDAELVPERINGVSDRFAILMGFSGAPGAMSHVGSFGGRIGSHRAVTILLPSSTVDGPPNHLSPVRGILPGPP